MNNVETAINRIAEELRGSMRPWYVGYSGGKDSSLVLKLVYQAMRKSHCDLRTPVTVVYCDTGVEIPLVRAFVYRTLARVSAEARHEGLPLGIKIAIPPVQDRYFVKVIGRGYPPPTNKFRWCTDRLRVKPIHQLLQTANPGVVVLGVRRGESTQRNRTLTRHRTDNPYYLKQAGHSKMAVFAPIIEFSTKDVWSALLSVAEPCSVDGRALLELYRHTDGECPVLRDVNTQPCAGSRFGCWTCTVVRRDRAVEQLIADGFGELQPLLDFRNWLLRFRENRRFRSSRRRNGRPGAGPFTRRGREIILEKLLLTQAAVGWTLVTDEELVAIKSLWRNDFG